MRGENQVAVFGSTLGPEPRESQIKHPQICYLVRLARPVGLPLELNIVRIRRTGKYLVAPPVASQLRLETAGPVCESVRVHARGCDP